MHILSYLKHRWCFWWQRLCCWLWLVTEHGDLRTKTEALKRVIQMMLNGEKMQSLLMTVIRFVMPLQDHTIKKMLLVFWEVVPKYTADGKMLHEMILVCDAYRKVYNVHAVLCCWCDFDFYQRVSIASYASAGIARAEMSIRLSVCPSHSGIVSKRRKLVSWFLHHPRAWTF